MTSEERHRRRRERREAKREANKQKIREQVDSFEQIFVFYYFMECSIRCCRGVRWKASVQRFELHCLTNTYKTKQRLIERTWKPKRASHFLLFDAGKLRQIDSVNVHTRAVQCTLCVRCIMPIALHVSISDNFASIPGRGTQAAINAFAQAIREAANNGPFTIWMFDFSSFFASILHEPVRQQLYAYIHNETLRYIIEAVFALFGGRGFQLGSHFSQCAAVLMGSYMDNYVKSQLHIAWYGRYSDDGFFIHNDVATLQHAVNAFDAVGAPFGLQLNKKKAVYVPMYKTALFLKKRFSYNDSKVVIRLVRKSAKKTRNRLKKLFRKYDEGKIDILQVIQSYNAWASYARPFDSYKTRIAMLGYVQIKLDERSIKYEVKRHYLLGLRTDQQQLDC